MHTCQNKPPVLRSIRTRFTRSYALLLCMMAFIVFFSAAMGLLYSRNAERLLTRETLCVSYYDALSETHNALGDYLLSPGEKSLAALATAQTAFSDTAAALAAAYALPQMDNYAYMADSYLRQAQDALASYASFSYAQANARYQQLGETKAIIEDAEILMDEVRNDDRAQTTARLHRQICTQIELTFLLLAASLVLGSALLHRYLNRLLDPLQRLTELARQVIAGNTRVAQTIAVTYEDEVAVLIRSFYSMLETINRQFDELSAKAELAQRLKEEELRRTRAEALQEKLELKVLQSRVNPHFLFNTLNTAISIALEEDADKTVQTLEIIAGYLRYSLARLGKIVCLPEEMRNIGQYIALQRLRFGERICFTRRLDPALAHAVAPAMILQPLVENALIHGVGLKEEGGQIDVSLCRQGDTVEMTVTDNGEGMTPEAISALKARLQDEKRYDDAKGIGLYNVYHRIRHHFQHGVDVSLQSEPGVRTAVCIRFPYETEDSL